MGKRPHQEVDVTLEGDSNPRAAKGRKSSSGSGGGAGKDASWSCYAGMIMRVKMKNFMCHAELDYVPTERLNFLHGANGSGKSAVLTAIVFGLGGSARISNRGNSNKNLIRNGENQAVVEIDLYNKGEDGYRKDLYGDKITVVRTVTAAGGGSYRLKNHRGRVVLDKKVKEELNKILEAFAIQVDNPIAILNQDSAKTFLFKCDPNKLYEFFMKATQLEECKERYNQAASDKSSAETKVAEKVEGLADIKAEKVRWEKKYQLLCSLEERKNKVRELKNELAWTLVKECDMQIDKEEKNRQGLDARVESLKDKLVKQDSIQRDFRTQKAEIEGRIQDLADEVAQKEREVDQEQSNLQKAKDKRKALEKQLSDSDRKLSKKTGELRSIDEAIEGVRATDEGEEKARRDGRLQKIEATKTRVKECEAKFASTSSHTKNLEHSISHFVGKERELKARLQKLNGEIREKNGQLANYRRQGDNKLIKFGDKMPRLVAEIEKNKQKFKQKPIGPLGAHIELQPNVSEAQAKAVEHEIGVLLRSFLVDNFEDKRMLDQMASRCGITNLTIITARFSHSVHNIAAGRCQSDQFPTVFDCLKVQDPNVTNCLIDHKKIETVILIDNEADAQSLLKSVRSVPKNCLYAITTGQKNQYYPAPNYRSYALNMGRQRPVLASSVEEIVDNLTAEVEALSGQVDALKTELEANQAEIGTQQREKAKGDQICRQMRTEMGRCNQAIMELQHQADNDKSPDISALEEDRERAAEEVENMEQKRQKIVLDIESAKEVETMQANRVEEKRQECLAHNEKRTPLTDELDQLHKDFANVKDAKKRLNGKMEEYSGQLQKSVAEIKELGVKRGEFLQRALKISKEPPFHEGFQIRSIPSIHRELQCTTESIRRQEESNEPKEVVLKKYRETGMLWAQVTSQIDELSATIKYLDSSLRYRKKGYTDMRGSIVCSVKQHFQYRLEVRKYEGNLDFNHKEHTLHINVNPNPGDDVEGNKARDIKTLSGGEKSFCTVSLVLAFWDDMQPPFRILDEFDVFMDSINRRIAIDLIINYAKEARKFQYMFLTPLNLEHLNDEKEDVQVIRFEKNQG